MEFSYVKLNAKKRLTKNCFKGFVISLFPYVTIFLLFLLNYHLYIFLKDVRFNFSPTISSYAVFIKATLFTISLVLSFTLWKFTCLLSDQFFYNRFTKKKSKITVRQIINVVMVSILRFFLSVFWGCFYLMPCAVVSFTLYYAVNRGEYTFNLLVSLFVSAVMLFVIGVCFLYATVGRYAMCNYVILEGVEKDSIKIIEKSINLLEGNVIRYAFYKLSLAGWVLSCVFILPLFYVLPYVKMARYSFYGAITKPKMQTEENQKPIIFYFPQKNKQYQ